jgi:hypothetical protein
MNVSVSEQFDPSTSNLWDRITAPVGARTIKLHEINQVRLLISARSNELSEASLAGLEIRMRGPPSKQLAAYPDAVSTDHSMPTIKGYREGAYDAIGLGTPTPTPP